MTSALTLLRHKLKDSVSNSSHLRNLASIFLRSQAAFTKEPKRKAQLETSAFQRSESRYLWKHWKHVQPATPVIAVREKLNPEGWSRYLDKLKEQTQINRSLLLKEPGPGGEKGVLLIQFEYNWFRLLTQIDDWQSFNESYDVIWGTSWSPTDYRLLNEILARVPGPIVVLPSGNAEIEKLVAFNERIVCPPVLSACDWLDPNCFNPKPRNQRQIDLLMVANWAPFKRHFELFAALPFLPKSARIVLIGQREGTYTKESLQHLARSLGVRRDLEIYESLPVEKVHEMQCDSRAAVILSRREGSCVAATESLFADCPIGIRKDAHVGALTHVNSMTGMRFDPGKLYRQLPDFLERSANFQPRLWATENISYIQSCRKLNEFMCKLSLETRRPWNSDLSKFCWNPYPEYLDFEQQTHSQAALDLLKYKYPSSF